MGEQDGVKATDKTVAVLPVHQDDASTAFLADVNQQKKILGQAAHEFDPTKDNIIDKTGRVAQVTVEGAAYGIVCGIPHAFWHDVTNLPETFGKALGAAFFGTAMRVALPAGGPGKALAGTIMLGYFAYDAARPLWEAGKVAAHTDDELQLTEAGHKLGDGLGAFALDSAIGAGAGMWADAKIGGAIESALGPKFIGVKEAFWNGDRSPVGRSFNWIADKVDNAGFALKDKWAPQPRVERLTDAEALNAVNQAANDLHRSFQDGGFYKKANFSDVLDELTGETTVTSADQRTPIEIRIRPPQLNLTNDFWRSTQSRDASPTPEGHEPEAVSLRIPINPEEARGGGDTGRGTATTQSMLDPNNFRKVADEAHNRQAKWTDELSQIADLKDGFAAPVASISDATRSGAILRSEFNLSRDDIMALIGKIQNVDHVKEAGMILRLHEMAAKQIELRDPQVASLNLLADLMHGKFVKMMRDGNIDNHILDGKVPSLVTISFDDGAGNFTIPAIDKVLRRPVTLFPRNQTELESVFAPINWHENLGHDHLYPELARFPDEYRERVLDEAVQRALKNHNPPIADSDMVVEGQTVKKSEVFKQLLLAQANENTADMIGTAVGGVGTPLSLGVLLQSLRKGGLLETRNVSSSNADQFPNVFEPHGFDAWRIKLSAEVMRHLGGGDAEVNAFADALDKYAMKASRPGDDYVIASVDDAHKGQMLKINRAEWDAVIPEIVRAQFDTPLPSFKTKAGEMKSLSEMLPNFTENFKKTNELATRMTDTVTQGKDTLVGVFDAKEFTKEYDIGQVYNAGLVAWLRASAQGEDAAASLDAISALSRSLRALYLESNPHAVPLQPSTLDQFKSDPIKVVSTSVAATTGRAAGKLQALRLWTAKNGTWAAGANGTIVGSDLADDLMKHLKTQAEMLGR